MGSDNRRGPCQDHGCYCQEFWPLATAPDFCEACDHDELFHRRWEPEEERADRRGHGACRWVKVAKDDDGFAVLDSDSNPTVLRSCKCQEFGPCRSDPGSVKCRACGHHMAFHKLLLGAASSVGVGPASSWLPSSSVATTSRPEPSAPPYEEMVKEQVLPSAALADTGKKGKARVPDPVPPPTHLADGSQGPRGPSSKVPRQWAQALPGTFVSLSLNIL